MRKPRSVLFGLSWLAVMGAANIGTAWSAGPADLPVRRFVAEGASIPEALGLLKKSLPEGTLLFGLEVAPYYSEPPRNLSISLENVTVGRVLEEIVRQDPQYEYQILDEHLIHVYPRQSKADPHNLLNLRVQQFKVSGVGYDELINYLPRFVPELQLEILRRSKVGGFVGSRLFSIGVPQPTLELENVTVREILNRVAQETEALSRKKFGPTGWIYTFQIDPSIPLGGYPRWALF